VELPEGYMEGLIARNREWFLQQLHTADNFARPGRRLAFRARMRGGKVTAIAEKRVGEQKREQE